MEKSRLGKYTGCLLGGAVGDALGAPIEFLHTPDIRRRFGHAGVRTYVEHTGGKGEFTDDTQMTLFTAEGLLYTANKVKDDGLRLTTYQSYLRWLYTQGLYPARVPSEIGSIDYQKGWLLKEKRLYRQRAPGVTCVGALESGTYGTVENPINHSKGCGGVMRIAPIGLAFFDDPTLAFQKGCEIAVLTHGHPSGYLSAGCFASMLACLIQDKTLRSAIEQTMEILAKWNDHQECLAPMNQALSLAQTTAPTPETIETLGKGWMGEEALAISIFCALHFQDNFREGVLAAVNHSGDCDSTGSITGNILGVSLGKGAIPQEWLNGLEMAEIVEQIAVDLYADVHGGVNHADPVWIEKYPPLHPAWTREGRTLKLWDRCRKAQLRPKTH